MRKGRSQYIKLLDGTQNKISTSKLPGWELTALGKTFYSKAVDRYTVLWPVRILLTRANNTGASQGSIFEREDWLPSTEVESLGEIEVPKNLSETAQRARVAQIERTWREQNATLIDGDAFMLTGYEAAYSDTRRQIEYNKVEYTQAGSLEATMHRPLREGKSWAFHGLQGVSTESLEETDGQCVSYQLSKHIRIKGKDAPWTQQQIAEMLMHITEALYEDAPENDPYHGACQDRILTVGFTAAAITQLCRELGVPIHVKWGECKIESYTPEHTQYESVALYIWKGHCYCVDDCGVKRAIVREQVSTPTAQSNEVQATIGRRANSGPASQYWDSYSKLAPGHFYTSDLVGVRPDLLREGICPQVRLSGMGMLQGLRYNDCTVHGWPGEAHICLKYLEELSKVRAHSLQYRGESLATFGKMLFDEFHKPCDRPFLTADIGRELAGKQRGRCYVCGDEIENGQLDHSIPRGGRCLGSDNAEGLKYLCHMCHARKTSEDRARMNVEDPNVYMSRFSEETWRGFVESRRPTQMVCNRNEATDRPCWEIDVRSCRLNGIVKGNVEQVPIYSPLDEFVKAKEGILYDYQWVDIGNVKCLLKKYIYDGPRWYDGATVKLMLETGVCKWRHIKLGFQATAHRPAADLASILKKIKTIWLEVGKSFQAEMLLGKKAEKKCRSELLSKTTLLSMLGSWGRTRITDTPW